MSTNPEPTVFDTFTYTGPCGHSRQVVNGRERPHECAHLLRCAAASMREDCGPAKFQPSGDPLMLAVADLLDGMAYSCSLDGHAPNQKALAVARAYLGRPS